MDLILLNKNTFPLAFYFGKNIDKKITMYYISIMRKKPDLVWDKWNKRHIEKHGVTIKEAEEAFIKKKISVTAKYGRQGVISRISNGRLIILFISYNKQSGPYIVSARDVGSKERRFYYEKTKSNTTI